MKLQLTLSFSISWWGISELVWILVTLSTPQDIHNPVSSDINSNLSHSNCELSYLVLISKLWNEKIVFLSKIKMKMKYQVGLNKFHYKIEWWHPFVEIYHLSPLLLRMRFPLTLLTSIVINLSHEINVPSQVPRIWILVLKIDFIQLNDLLLFAPSNILVFLDQYDLLQDQVES